MQRLLGVQLDDPAFRRARATYLEGFAHSAGEEDLGAPLELACRVAKVARDDGDEIDDDWLSTPLESVASLLDESYLGGA